MTLRIYELQVHLFNFSPPHTAIFFILAKFRIDYVNLQNRSRITFVFILPIYLRSQA